MTKILLTNGDSWTFGSEIMAPEFLVSPGEKGYGMANRYKKGHNDIDTENDYYRIPRIWPYSLSKLLERELINLSWPARSNDSIYDSTISWILDNYISKNLSTNDLMIVIGWSSPERKNVIFSDERQTYIQTIWPAMTDNSFYHSDIVRDYFYMHVNHLWTEYEYISRFIDQNFNLYNFCKLHNIKLYTFTAFYQTPNTDPTRWDEINISTIINNWDHTKLSGWVDPAFNWKTQIESLKFKWNSISNRNYILKDQQSFKGYIDDHVPVQDRMINWHPSPNSHKRWSEFVANWIKSDNNIQRFSSSIRKD